jgi:signal recognition particle GTPase
MKMKRRPNASGRRQQRANASSSSSKEEEKTEKTKVVVLTREAGKNEQMRKILASIDEDKDNEFVVETLEMPLVESKRNEEEAKKLVDLLKSKTFRWIIVTSPEAANVFAKAWADAGNRGRRDDESVADEGGDEVGETVYAVESVGGGVGGRVAVGYNRR